MEGSPYTSEDDSGKSETPSKKKKKSAESLGAFIVEPKKEAALETDKDDAKNFLEKLFRGDEQAPDAEASETDSSPEETSPTEDQAIVERLEAAQPEPYVEPDEVAGPEIVEAIETFRDKISEHLTPAVALQETLDELDIEPGAEPDRPTTTLPESSMLPPAELPLTGERTIYLGNLSPAVEERAPAVDETADEQPAGTSAGNGHSPPRSPVTHAANFGPAGSGFSPHVANTYATPARARPEYIRVNNESDAVGMALLGGIIGYLIGRRRGRIKSEKRLRPVQKKLEKRVAYLQEDLIAKETRLRRAVSEQVRQRDRLTRVERSDRQLRRRMLVRERTDRAAQRAVAPEASRLHGAAPQERIGRVVIGAEALAAAPRLPSRRIETLSHDELLAVSEKIPVEHSNLRQIYETHLVSEQGLRRLVETQAEGGNLKQAVRQEIMEHDIDFERDPIMRDRRSHTTAAASSGAATLNILLATKAVHDDQAHDEAAVLVARASYETAQQARYQNQRRVADIGLVGTIMVLLAAIVILLLSRG